MRRSPGRAESLAPISVAHDTLGMGHTLAEIARAKKDILGGVLLAGNSDRGTPETWLQGLKPLNLPGLMSELKLRPPRTAASWEFTRPKRDTNEVCRG